MEWFQSNLSEMINLIVTVLTAVGVFFVKLKKE